MKRLVSMALAVMLLISTISGVGTVFAEETASTTLQEWMFYDFEGTKPDWVDATATSEVYDIGIYRNDWHVETLNLNGTAGIEKTDGLTMEVEFDCKIGDLLNNGIKGGGVLYVSTGEGETPATPGYSNFYGSVAATYNSETNVACFDTWNNNYNKAFGSAELDKWYRVKMVMPIGDTVQTYSVYVDGVKMNPRTQAGVSATDVVKFLCIEASGANSCIDNLRVVTYTAAKDAPVDKGALIAAIRDFEEEYLGYATVETAAKNIEVVKAVYKNTAATADEVTAAIAKINETKTILDYSTTLQEWMFYDFETKPDWVVLSGSSDVYDIGTYRDDWRAVNLNLNGETGIEKTAGLTMEVEFDCKIGGLLNNATNGGGVVYVSTGEGESPSTPGYSNYYGTVSATYDSVDKKVAGFNVWSNNYGTDFGSAELDKWYRVKMVMPIGDTQSQYSVYIDGVKTGSRNQQGVSATDVVKFLCISGGNAHSCVDNLRVVTYTAAKDAPVDKGALIAAIRDFEEEYLDYATVETAAKNIEEVKAVYKNTDATAEEVTAAIAKINETKTFLDSYTTLQEWMFYDFETKPDWVVLSGSSDVYDIGTYRDDWRAVNINLNGETGIEKTAGLTMEVEFDCKIGGLLNNATKGGGVVYVSTGEGESPSTPGYSNFYGTVSATYDSVDKKVAGFNVWSNNYGTDFGSAELDKWYRVKMVMPIGNTRQTYSVYINGVKTGSVNQQGVSETDVVKFLCIFGGNAHSCVDNLRVVTYTRTEDAPVDKGALIAAIRDFEEEYPNYTKSEVSADFINQAKAVYENKEAKQEDVTAAMKYVQNAVDMLYGVLNEKFEKQPENYFTGIDNATYIEDAAYDINYALNIPSASNGTKAFAKEISTLENSECKYLTASCDVKVDGEATVKIADDVLYNIKDEDNTWKRLYFDLDIVNKKYNVYYDGVQVVTNQEFSAETLSQFTVCDNTNAMNIDNILVSCFENTEDVVADKGKLIKALRIVDAYLKSDEATSSEIKIISISFEPAKEVYENDNPTKDDITQAAEKVAFWAENVSNPEFDIAEMEKAEFEKEVNSTYGLDEITKDVEQMAGEFLSPITNVSYDLFWIPSNNTVLSEKGVVNRPVINEKITVDLNASSGDTGMTFNTSFNAKVMAQGDSVALPQSGAVIAYANVETAGEVSVAATGISETVTVAENDSEIQLYADTNAGKYAIFVNSEKVKQGEFDAAEITSATINGVNANVIKRTDTDSYEIKGLKFKIGEDDREYAKIARGAKVSAVEVIDRNPFGDEATLMIAAYSNGGTVLESVNSTSINNTKLDETNKIDIELDLPEDTSDLVIKAYVFSSLTTLKPMASMFTYDASKISTDPTIYIIGDSTAETMIYSGVYPKKGWGERLEYNLTDGINVVNLAKSGSTIKSLYKSTTNQSYTYIKENISPGDYLLMQHGHNHNVQPSDTEEFIENHRCNVEDYYYYMQEFIDMAEESGATPIIITSIPVRNFASAEGISDGINPYREAAKEIAKNNNLDCIDLGETMRKLLVDVGNDTAGTSLYMNIDADDVRYRNDPDWATSNYKGGCVDNSHLSLYGANIVSMLVAREFLTLESTQAIKTYVDEEMMLNDTALRTKITDDYQAYLELKNAQN